MKEINERRQKDLLMKNSNKKERRRTITLLNAAVLYFLLLAFVISLQIAGLCHAAANTQAQEPFPGKTGYDIRVLQGESVTAEELANAVLAKGETFSDVVIEEEIRYGKCSPVAEAEHKEYTFESYGDRIFLLTGKDREGRAKTLTVRVAVDVPDDLFQEGTQNDLVQTIMDEKGNRYTLIDRKTGSRGTEIRYADGDFSILWMLANGAFYTIETRGEGTKNFSESTYSKSTNGTITSTYYGPEGGYIRVNGEETWKLGESLLPGYSGKIVKYREAKDEKISNFPDGKTNEEVSNFPDGKTDEEISNRPDGKTDPATRNEETEKKEDQENQETKDHPEDQENHSNLTHEHTWLPVTKEVQHEAITHTVYHEAVIHTVSHPAETQSILHEAVTHTVFHPAVTREIVHEAVTHTIVHPAITHTVLHEAVTHTVEHPEETDMVFHEENGHYERVLVQEAWEESVCTKEAWEEPVLEFRTVCNGCGRIVYGDYGLHILECDKWGSYHSEWVQTGTIPHEAEYTTIYHEAEYENVWIVDSPAWAEEVVISPAWVETVVDQEAWEEEVVDEPAWEEVIVDSEAWTETVVDQEAWEEVVDEPAWEETIIVREAWEETIVDEPAWEEEVVDSPAWTETVIMGYICRDCGDTKNGE